MYSETVPLKLDIEAISLKISITILSIDELSDLVSLALIHYSKKIDQWKFSATTMLMNN